MSVTPELGVLLRVASAPSAADGRAGVRADVDADALLALADRHALGPLLGARAPALGLELPAATARRLRELRLRTTALALAQKDDLRRVLADLEQAGVAALPFKGPTLGTWLYGDPGLRPGADLDLLVGPRDVVRARARLLALGWSPCSQPPERLLGPYVRLGSTLYFTAPGRADVDLHWRLGGPEFPIRLGVDALRARARMVAPGLRTFAAEDMLLFLCAHGGKHRWERLLWLADVARLVAGTPELDAAALRERAARLGLSRLLDLGLRLARDHLGARLPPSLAAEVERDRAAARLAEVVAAGWTASLDDGATARLSFAMRCRDRARDRARAVLGALLLPTEHEWTSVEVPTALYPAYAVWRPARLAAKYARRLVERRPSPGA